MSESKNAPAVPTSEEIKNKMKEDYDKAIVKKAAEKKAAAEKAIKDAKIAAKLAVEQED